VVIALLCTSLARAQTIYYAVFEGNNYEKETWHVVDLKEFNANRPGNVFDLYRFERLSDGTSKVMREFSTPSGDWMFLLTYHYDKNGRLNKLESEFRTFGGVTISGDGGSTRCVRSFVVSNNGELQKTSERITDMKTGREVTRSFYEPAVKHWMHLRDLPIQPKA
jgi:hypothetical protein